MKKSSDRNCVEEESNSEIRHRVREEVAALMTGSCRSCVVALLRKKVAGVLCKSVASTDCSVFRMLLPFRRH